MNELRRRYTLQDILTERPYKNLFGIDFSTCALSLPFLLNEIGLHRVSLVYLWDTLHSPIYALITHYTPQNSEQLANFRTRNFFVHMYWYIKNFLLIISLSRTILFTYGCRKYFFLSYKIIVFYFTQYFQISFFRYFSLKKYFSPILILIPFYNIKISFICKVFWILFETDCFGSSSFQ